jgi:hypothetical protein
MTALTHQSTSRTLVAITVLAAAVLGLIIALGLGIGLGITATGGHGGGAAPGSRPVPGSGFRAPGCLVCYR